MDLSLQVVNRDPMTVLEDSPGECDKNRERSVDRRCLIGIGRNLKCWTNMRGHL